MLLTNKKLSLGTLLLLSAMTVMLSWQKNDNAIIVTKTNIDHAQAMTDLTLNVSPGSLRQSIESDSTTAAEVALSTVDVFLAPATGDDSTGNLKTNIHDHRGVAAGWTQTVTCSNFVDEYSNVITVDKLTITPNTISPISNSNIVGLILGSGHTFVDEMDTVPIVIAPPGTGLGRFRVQSDLKLHIEKTVIPGNYKADMTVTIS
jgi:hypothetical protein